MAAEPETVEGVVTAIVHEFNQVDVESADGRSFVVTCDTPGVLLDQLQLGQRLVLRVVMNGSSKVLHARLSDS